MVIFFIEAVSKVDFKEIVCEDVDRIYMARNRTRGKFLWTRQWTIRFHKGKKRCFDYVNNYQLLNKESAS
jgi:hypothetical protein